MDKLLTPFGKIKILIDSKPVPYDAQKGRKLENGCPNVLGRYHIVVRFIPDGKEHTIACVFEADGAYERSLESGEQLECQGFYNDRRYKMSIGLEYDVISDEYDYDADYLENGMAFLIGTKTKTECYTFGIAWIDNVGWNDRNDTIDKDSDRDAETWYGADPVLML